MAKQSAGLLVYRIRDSEPEVLLVHPGGPFWKDKDAHAWSIPKGEYLEGEEPLDAARREFLEETGFTAAGEFIGLTPIRQAGGKVVTAWALQADFDVKAVKSNRFSMEWPPRSGRMQEFPEIDRAEWFTFAEARNKINKAQAALLYELSAMLHIRMDH